MADLIFVSITLGFFIVCTLYVRWCDRIIGPDTSTGATEFEEPSLPLTEVAA